MDNNYMHQPLTEGDGGDNHSQTSNQSRSNLSGSLLDRIRAQRSRDQQGGDAAELGQMIVGPAYDPLTPTQISVPTYRDHDDAMMMNPMMASHNNSNMSELGASSMMMSTVRFGSGFVAPPTSQQQGRNNNMMVESLLGDDYPRHAESQHTYSMTQYFQTFVMDVYSSFRSLPVWAQGVLIIFLVFLVIKWI
jgi:hypothetical protein